MSPKILIVDDKPGVRQLLEGAFSQKGFEVSSAANGDAAYDLIQESIFDAVITDLKMPGRDGIELLRAAKERSVDTQVIVVTAYGTMETAVEAMRLGAYDFIAKPFKLAEIEMKVDRMCAEHGGAPPTAVPASTKTPAPPARAPVFEGEPRSVIVGESSHTKQLIAMIKKLGPSSSSVLITGPSGVGKELVARQIHECSGRRDKPFVALNCAALAPGVLESELFGHEKGAFTGAIGRREGRFERADKGTLFLDEVGETDPAIQAKLLRVLQEGEFERVGGTDTIKVDVRIVAATNRELTEAIKQGIFREDFYYRLKVFSLAVEPLCNRKDDIPALVDHFLTKFSAAAGKRVTGIEDDVMDVFMNYPWPGNVRELQNVLERAVVLAEGETITREEIPPELFYTLDAPRPKPEAPKQPTLIEQTDRLESELIYGALQRFRWNKTKTAEHLGLKRTTLQYKIKKYGLE